LRVQNANAVSGPFTWGFPSPTAFTGFAHALNRRFSDQLQKGFGGVGIVCHRFEPQITKGPGGRSLKFNLTRNPLRENGKPASFVEEGRAHIEVTLLIGVDNYMTLRAGESFAYQVAHAVEGMRLAGGSIMPMSCDAPIKAEWIPLSDDAESRSEQFRKLRRRLLPGFALVQRQDILADHINDLRRKFPGANALDALLDLSRLNFEPDIPVLDKPGESMWGIRTKPGWLVPLSVGYGALSPVYDPGKVKGARDCAVPFRFVENLYSLGEWISPHRLTCFEDIFWYHDADSDKGVYLCVNAYSKNHNTNASTEV
jgi:CRISPR-associated protein Csy2